MSDVIMRKTMLAGRPCLVPVDDDGIEYMARIRNNRDVGVKVTQHRNPRHHRLYFAILKFVREHAVIEGEHIFEDADQEMISTAVKMATGLCRTFIDTESGKAVMAPRSISWGAMDQTEFAPFFQKACDVICKRWMPAGTTPEDVRRELILMVDGPHALGERVA